ncbi:MAG: hypothetical protein RMN24_01085 [Anaerolineae bacterium]|nr:hypothetical protein [Caldilineales bacterium]MCX7853043.1 hypothetical protein [Caldilineales bacterium]MDW8267733.1 hypothetical protein [Anaerolineae bacterium]
MPTSPEFNGYLRIVLRRWWLLVLLPTVAAGVILALVGTAPPEYMAYERLQVQVIDPQEVPLFTQTRVTTLNEQIQAVHDDFYDILRLPSVAWRTIADLNLSLSAEELIRRLDSQDRNNFITVTLRMPTPELAQQVLSRHVENAVTTYRSIRSRPAETSLGFIEAQLAEQARVLAASQKALQDFQLANEVGDLDREILAYQDLKRTLRNERDRSLTEAARNDRLAAQYEALARETEARIADLTATPAAEATLAATPTADAAQTTREVETLRELARRQRLTAADYRAAAEGHRAAAAEFDRQLAERQQELVYLLSLQERYKTLVDEVNRAAATYSFLADKANEARLKLNQGENIGFLQVVEPASLPQNPLPSRTPQLVLVGVLGGLLLAVILAFLLEAVERNLKPREQPSRPVASPPS